MAIGARGEVSLGIDGRPRRLCLTLGALAIIETELGCTSLSELRARLASLSASDLVTVVRALLIGGGEVGVAETLEAASLAPGPAAKAVAETFQAALE